MTSHPNNPDDVSCDGCGACCREVGTPPFLGFEIYSLPEELRDEVLEKGCGTIWDEDPRDKQPCYWLDEDTGRCKHYQNRPQLCQDFEVGGVSCLSYREYYNLDQ